METEAVEVKERPPRLSSPGKEWHFLDRQTKEEWVRANAYNGFSGGQMAQVAGVTRNVIIGVCNRAKPKITLHGLSNPYASGIRPLPVKARPKAPTVKNRGWAGLAETPSKKKPPKEVPVPRAPPMGSLATLGDRKLGQCCFPLFDDARRHPAPLTLPYCGHPTGKDGQAPDPSRTYCPYHEEIMHPAPKVDRRPSSD